MNSEKNYEKNTRHDVECSLRELVKKLNYAIYSLTDEEKARKVALNNRRLYDDEDSFHDCYDSALEMAEWKNMQLKLTVEDIGVIFNLVLRERQKYTDQSGCYKDVLRIFYELKEAL